MGEVKPIPDGYPQVTPYLCVDDAKAAIQYYVKVFGGRERMHMPTPDGKIGHAEVEIGDSVIMLSDEQADINVLSPKTIGGSPVLVNLYVEDADAVFKAAIDNGGTVLREVEHQFYGDRSGQFTDPFGHRWSVATHVEDVPPDEMEKRMQEFMGS